MTAAEIATAMGVSKRAVNKRALKEAWPYEATNGRGDRKYKVDTLPQDVRIALTAGTLPAPAPVRIPVGSPDLADWQNEIALARADLLRAYVEEKRKAKAAKKSVMEATGVFIAGYNTGHLLPKVYKVVGKTARQTVEAWLKEYRESGYDYAVLAPQWGNRKGQRKVTEEEFNTMLSFGLHPNRLRKAEVVRLAKLALEKRGIESPSSIDTLRRSLDDWIRTNYDRWIWCREGEKALVDKCLPYLDRDAGLLEVGEVLVADGHMLNFQVLHPFTGKPCRPAMVLWYDWASRMPAGWEIMPTEDVQCVAAGLRRAILTLGKMPRVAYLDNGKAFKAKVFTSRDVDFEEAGFYGMFARLGIETIFAWPYNAQSKPVERFFGTFGELERLLPTYTGFSIQEKPAHLLRNERLHKAIHEKKYGGWVPTIEETNRIIAGWVEEYAAREHKGLRGLRPEDLFESGRGPGVDEGALRHLMMGMKIDQVGRNGVNLLGRHYYDDALYGLKCRVTVRYDYEDLSRVLVYDETGARLICEAEAVKKVHPIARIGGNKEDLAEVKEQIRRKRALKRRTELEGRAYVAEAPQLVELPERSARLETAPTGRKVIGLTPVEAERIEEAAAKMKVLELRPKKADPVYMTEPDRYEALLERECRGGELTLEDMRFMRYFEGTALYASLRERFEFLRELWLAGEEEGKA